MRARFGLTGITVVTLCWLAGLALGSLLQPPLLYLFIASTLLLALAWWRPALRGALPAAVFLLLGMVRVSLPAPPNALSSILSTRPAMQQPITGTITAGPDSMRYSSRYELRLRRMSGQRVRGRVLLYATRADLRPGDNVSCLAEVKRVEPQSNFGTFDYEEYLASRGIGGIAFARGVVRAEAGKTSFPRAVDGVRRWLRQRIAARCGNQAPFARAFLLGEVVNFDRDRLQRAGLAHLLAVSGLHVMLLGLVLYLLFRALLPWPWAARSAMLAGLLFYAALCAWRPSVTRAVLMVGLYTLGRLMQRKPPPLHVLALTALIVTCAQPLQLFQAGFQLSYLAVLALVVFLPPLGRVLRRVLPGNDAMWARLLRYFVELAASSLLIGLTLAPVTLYHFHSLSLNGVVGNLLALPLFSLLLPVTLLLAVAPGFLVAWVQASFFLLTDILGWWTGIAAAAPLWWPVVGLPGWRALALVLALAPLAGLLYARTRRARVVSAALVVVLFVLVALPAHMAQHRLRITFFDVGVGDMALIELPDGGALVMDAGPPEDDPGHVERTGLPYIAGSGVRTLEAVFITHAHADHYGGLAALCNALTVKRIVVNAPTLRRCAWLDSLAAAEGCPLQVLADTLTFRYGAVSLHVLHPDGRYAPDDVNDESMVARLDYGGFSALFTGDLEQHGERWLLEHRPQALKATLLKVGHHGSDTSSGEEFLRAVAPQYALVSVSERNKFHLPSAVVLDRLATLGDRLYLTGRDGSVQLETDGKQMWVKTAKNTGDSVPHPLQAFL